MRFRFSIRELFLIVCVIAVALGWWCDRQRMAHYNEKVSLVLQHQMKVPGFVIPQTINEYYDELVQRGFKGFTEEEELPFASAPQPATKHAAETE
jgi:hypothetical protein